MRLAAWEQVGEYILHTATTTYIVQPVNLKPGELCLVIFYYNYYKVDIVKINSKRRSGLAQVTKLDSDRKIDFIQGQHTY